MFAGLNVIIDHRRYITSFLACRKRTWIRSYGWNCPIPTHVVHPKKTAWLGKVSSESNEPMERCKGMHDGLGRPPLRSPLRAYKLGPTSCIALLSSDLQTMLVLEKHGSQRKELASDRFRRTSSFYPWSHLHKADRSVITRSAIYNHRSHSFTEKTCSPLSSKIQHLKVSNKP